MRRRPIALLLPSALCLWACTANLPGPEICSAAEPCGPGRSCVLGRCRPGAALPVGASAMRIDFTPERLARLTSAGAALGPGPAETIVLGRPDEGTTMLLLGFVLRLPADAKLQAALLVLQPAPGCPPETGELDLELAQVLSPWRPEDLSWARRPELGLPMRAATLRAAPPRALRLDVTELVEQWREHAGRYHGLALLARSDARSGACFGDGLGAVAGPHLELYLAPRPEGGPDAGADGGGT
ncbi:MAG: hypothetical protein HY744_18085 [Deltaproteobacteria bacterium]|nr:hypothetical protein [Deltaproteobacteria bacterium]